jgi:thiamine-phosphate pyrophosphorylase
MDRLLLRLLDANANRAREALRVLEDYARFVLDDRCHSAALKDLRHELADATKEYLPDAILQRDTPGDVGTGNKTVSELSRVDLCEVITAGGKRAGEALRAIEECLKTVAPDRAASVEKLRYRLYGIEQQLALTLRPDPSRFDDVRLYVLITESCCRRPWLEAAEEAILGGADCLQLREKDLDSGEMLARARQLVNLCRGYGVLFIINDRPDIAMLAGADGVHLGQTDLPAREVRKLIGHKKILGVSTHRIEQARQAQLDGADYLGVGPFFPSPTKPRDFVAGPAYARHVVEQVPLSAVAIAGITPDNVDEVLATGVRAVAVTAAVIGQDDVRGAAARLKAKLGAGRRRSVGRTFLPVSGVTQVAPLGGTGIPACSGTDISVCPGSAEGQLGETSLPGSRGKVADAPSPVAQAFLPVVPQTFLSVGDGPTGPSRNPDLEIKTRNLPHWRLDGSTYFITFRLRSGELNPRERLAVLDHIRAGHRKFYNLLGAVIMPDHAHALLTPASGIDLSRITKGTKGVTANLVNKMRGRKGQLWQDETWDRIVRDQDELDEKLRYLVYNPVKAGLAADGWEYGALFINEDVN